MLAMAVLARGNGGNNPNNTPSDKPSFTFVPLFQNTNLQPNQSLCDDNGKAGRSNNDSPLSSSMDKSSASASSNAQNQSSENNNLRDPFLAMTNHNASGQTFLSKLAQIKAVYEDTLNLKRLKLGNSHRDLAPILNSLGDINCDMGNHDDAMRCYTEALEIRQKAYGPGDHAEIASSISSIGVLCWLKGSYDEALKQTKAALAMCESLDDEQGAAVSLTNLGLVFNAMGQHEEAFKVHKRALKIQRRFELDNTDEDKTHMAVPDISQTLQNMGTSLVALSRWDEAVESFEEALRVRESLIDGDHPSIASIYLSLGGVYGKKGDKVREMETYRKALKMFQSTMGYEHSSVSAAMANIGNALGQAGHYEEAMNSFKEALRIKLLTVGDEHPSIGDIYNSIGNVQLSMGQYDEAYDAYREALRIRTAAFGDSHPSVYATLGNLGCIMGQKGDVHAAMEIFEETLLSLIEKLGPNHLSVANTKCNIGTIYMHQNNANEALRYFKDSLAIMKDCGNNEIADLCCSIGQIHDMNNENDEALKYFNEALDNQCCTIGPESIAVSQTLNRIGPLLAQRGEYQKSLATFAHALRLQRQHLGSDHTMTAMTLHNYGNVSTFLTIRFSASNDRTYFHSCLSISLQTGIDPKSVRKFRRGIKLV